ncbi:hypothetical protein SFC22_06485 [Bacillus altitudinis]|uniref:hypothetical protein n=1 Tax=Bacillus altitudinis TaxID=293387 RepID=UPI00045C6458|nr:hypothetical protein [Bacillus altitudinis]KDE31580.1 hypothetical protein BA79_07286 [Bacillus altitudinis 41KF2b]MEC1043192.1 hypothetical protein [Bacillus altitudinis]MEC1092456.1 hypothetical protein [Bacillus altitudinis]
MKFYEVHDPYYALIKAKTEENAMTIYTDVVADDDGGLSEEITEVTEAYAAIRHSRTVDADERILSIEKVIEDITNEEEMLLGMDRSLI